MAKQEEPDHTANRSDDRYKNYRPTQITFSPEMLAVLKRLRYEEDRSVSAIVREAVGEYLERRNKQP